MEKYRNKDLPVEERVEDLLDRMTFEEKIKLLEEIVKELESGEVPLDEAIEKYTSAMKLAKECSDKLNEVSEKVNKIMLENGKLEDFTVSE